MSKIDGVSTVTVGVLGLHEQRDGSYWARGEGGLDVVVEETTHKVTGEDGVERVERSFFARVEIDEVPVALGEGPTVHDATRACTEEAALIFEALSSLFGGA